MISFHIISEASFKLDCNTVDLEQSPCSLYYVAIIPISVKNTYFMLCEFNDNIFKERYRQQLI